MTSSSTAPSFKAKLGDVAGESGGIRIFDWVYYPTLRAYVATVVGYIYTDGDSDYHYTVDITVGVDEVDAFGEAEIRRIVDERRRQAIRTIVGVRDAKRRELSAVS